MLCSETGGFNESISSGGIYGYTINIYIYISLSLSLASYCAIGVVYFVAMQSNQLQQSTAREENVLSQDIQCADVKQSEVTVRWVPPKSLGGSQIP